MTFDRARFPESFIPSLHIEVHRWKLECTFSRKYILTFQRQNVARMTEFPHFRSIHGASVVDYCFLCFNLYCPWSAIFSCITMASIDEDLVKVFRAGFKREHNRARAPGEYERANRNDMICNGVAIRFDQRHTSKIQEELMDLQVRISFAPMCIHLEAKLGVKAAGRQLILPGLGGACVRETINKRNASFPEISVTYILTRVDPPLY